MYKFKQILAGAALTMLASSAQAIPTLFFDGDINYSGGILSVRSVLTATEDITPIPNLIGSSLDFTVLFASVDTTSAVFTKGNFGTTAGTDLTVIDGNATGLLAGNFNELQMVGGNGLDSGLITGTFSASSGTLHSGFDVGNLFAFGFNLSTVFSADMFRNDFTGAIDGRIEGQAITVTEPTPLALLALGLLLVGFIKQSRIHRPSL